MGGRVTILAIILLFLFSAPVLAEPWEQSLLAQNDEPTIFERFDAFYDSIYKEVVGEKPPRLGRWRWAKDSWIGKDKLKHMEFYTLLYSTGIELGLRGRESFWLTVVVSILNEVKDGLVPWEFYGSLGGDGASYKDEFYSIIVPAIFEFLTKE